MNPLTPDSLTESLHPPRYNALAVEGAAGETAWLENLASLADREHPDYLGRRVEPVDAAGNPAPFRFPDLAGPALQFVARRLYESLCVRERWCSFTTELLRVTDRETGEEREPRRWDLLSITRGEGEPGEPEVVTVDSYERFWDAERGRERARLEVRVGVHEPLPREFLEVRPCGAPAEEFVTTSLGTCPHSRTERRDPTTGERVCALCGAVVG